MSNAQWHDEQATGAPEMKLASGGRMAEITTPIRIRLPHGETNPKKIYSFPNPHHEPEATWAVRYWIYGDGPQPTKDQLGQVLVMADAYKDLTMYELGQECCVRKLRDIWRALRAGAGREKST